MTWVSTPPTTAECFVSHFRNLPTEDRRKELCKQVSKICEESKVAVRNVRRDALDKLKAKKKNSEITEDDLKEAEKNVQKITDKYIETIDAVGADKDKEIMSI